MLGQKQARVVVRVAQRQKILPPCDKGSGVFGVGVFVKAFAAGVRLVVNQNGRWALQDAPAFLQYAQAQVHVSKSHAQQLIHAVHGVESIFANERASCGDG